MITLLPQSERFRVRTEYRLRLATLALLGGAAWLVVCAVALLPAYFAAALTARAEREEAEVASRALENSALKAAGESVRASQAILTAAKAGLESPRPSSALSELLKARPSGVTVTRIEYSFSGEGLTVRLSGIAGSREKLLSFRDAVQDVPGVEDADIPIDNLAKAADIPFALSVTFAPVTP